MIDKNKVAHNHKVEGKSWILCQMWRTQLGRRWTDDNKINTLCNGGGSTDYTPQHM